MAKSSHPSAQSRVSSPATAIGFLSQRLRRAVPSLPSGKLPSRSPAPFHKCRPSLHIGNSKKSEDLLEGSFHFAGQVLDVGPWTVSTPSRRFASWLHEFDWLHDLLAGDTDAHRAKARDYVDGWIEIYGHGNEFVMDPSRMSRRLFNWLTLWTPALSGVGKADPATNLGRGDGRADRRRASVLRQLTVLRGSLKSIRPGLPRLTAGCALVLGGARMADGRSQFLERGLDLLDVELPLQILPDGGHISRSPEACVEALEQLLILDSLLADRGLEGSREISRSPLYRRIGAF